MSKLMYKLGKREMLLTGNLNTSIPALVNKKYTKNLQEHNKQQHCTYLLHTIQLHYRTVRVSIIKSFIFSDH